MRHSHTYRPMNSVHPGDVHYFADEVDVSDLLHDFSVISRSVISRDVSEHNWDYQRTKQFSSYWQILARR